MLNTLNRTRSASPSGQVDTQALAVNRECWTVSFRPLWIGIAGGVLMWASFPPLGWWPLAWLATLPWLWLVLCDHLPGPRPYGQLYVAGVVSWLILIQWIRLPHWAAYFGWAALSIYLGVYLPLFVAVTRRMVHQWRWPLMVSAPIVWTGLEYARAYVLTGFSLLLLGHSQVNQLTLIQIADLGGAYLVSFLMMFTTAAVAQTWLAFHQRRSWIWPLPMAAGLIAATCLYGNNRLATMQKLAEVDHEPRLRVGLVQGSIDTRFDDPSPLGETHNTYMRLSADALARDPSLQMLIWPESVYWHYDESMPPPPTRDPQQAIEHFQMAVNQMGDATARSVAARLRVPLLVGCALIEYVDGREHRYNSVIAIDRHGTRTGRYDKMHPVMFGEYVPLGDWFPWLYRLTPMGGGLTAGRTPLSVEIEGLRFCPSICFENTVPQLIRRQVREMVQRGQSPDVLVTATNDGWFWGSSLLDHHLSCGIFRAIELRRPMLIAANTGFSASIDVSGNVLAKGPRRQEGFVVAEVRRHPAPESVYFHVGDLAAASCLIMVLVAAITAWIR